MLHQYLYISHNNNNWKHQQIYQKSLQGMFFKTKQNNSQESDLTIDRSQNMNNSCGNNSNRQCQTCKQWAGLIRTKRLGLWVFCIWLHAFLTDSVQSFQCGWNLKRQICEWQDLASSGGSIFFKNGSKSNSTMDVMMWRDVAGALQWGRSYGINRSNCKRLSPPIRILRSIAKWYALYLTWCGVIAWETYTSLVKFYV